jgi:cell division protein FtsB
MKLISIFISAGASALALVLAIVLAFNGAGVIEKQSELQKRQQKANDVSQELQTRNQEIQIQQQTLEKGEYLVKQAAPAVFNQIALKSVKNDKLAAMLKKYNMSNLVDQARKAQSEKPVTTP